jgi:hypothetical protein
MEPEIEPEPSRDMPMPGEEINEEAELEYFVWVLAEKIETAGETGADVVTDNGDCGQGCV